MTRLFFLCDLSNISSAFIFKSMYTLSFNILQICCEYKRLLFFLTRFSLFKGSAVSCKHMFYIFSGGPGGAVYFFHCCRLPVRRLSGASMDSVSPSTSTLITSPPSSSCLTGGNLGSLQAAHRHLPELSALRSPPSLFLQTAPFIKCFPCGMNHLLFNSITYPVRKIILYFTLKRTSSEI